MELEQPILIGSQSPQIGAEAQISYKMNVLTFDITAHRNSG